MPQEPAENSEAEAPEPKVRKHSMFVTAANLMSSTVITSVLGVVFWALAARLYTTDEVGLANAALSAATLLAAFAQLSLGTLCSRYLPRAGHYSGWILRRVYLVVCIAAVVLGVGFVIVAKGSDYVEGFAAAALFVLAVLSLTVFAVQDSALLGLGRVRVVPIENTLFAIVKIALLPVLASATVVSGIFAAWIIPAVIAGAAVGYYMFFVVVPQRSKAVVSVPLPSRRILWPQMANQFASVVTSQLGYLGVPLIITALLGATQNAYLAIAWLVGISFNSLLLNVTYSFAYHVRSGEAITVASLRRLGLLIGLVGGVGAVVTFVAAPLILMIIAPGYQEEATPVLRLIALSVPFMAIFIVYYTFLWLENRIIIGAIAYGVMSAGMLTLTYVLAPKFGIVAAGWALLASTGVIGLASVRPMIKRVGIVRRGGGDRWISPETAQAST